MIMRELNPSEIIKKKQYVEQEGLYVLADNVIKEEKLEIEPARIRYELVYPSIDKITIGKCSLLAPHIRFIAKCEFIIQFSGEIWDVISDATRRIIMWHELCHVGVVYNDKSGTFEYSCIDHDINEFRSINERHGVYWLDTLCQEVRSANIDVSSGFHF